MGLASIDIRNERPSLFWLFLGANVPEESPGVFPMFLLADGAYFLAGEVGGVEFLQVLRHGLHRSSHRPRYVPPWSIGRAWLHPSTPRRSEDSRGADDHPRSRWHHPRVPSKVAPLKVPFRASVLSVKDSHSLRAVMVSPQVSVSAGLKLDKTSLPEGPSLSRMVPAGASSATSQSSWATSSPWRLFSPEVEFIFTLLDLIPSTNVSPHIFQGILALFLFWGRILELPSHLWRPSNGAGRAQASGRCKEGHPLGSHPCQNEALAKCR